MKTKQLIKELQEVDPSGELECCIDNVDIIDVVIEPAYYDGCLQVLIRDETNPYYDVIGAKIVGEGKKVVISPLSIRSAIMNDHNIPIYYEGVSKVKQEDYEEFYAKERQKSIDLSNDVERGFFIDYLKKKYPDFSALICDVATAFYAANMNYNDPMPEDILHSKVKQDIGKSKVVDVIPSWKERREKQWDREIRLDVVDGKPVLCFNKSNG
jgi:hypothetical protein